MKTSISNSIDFFTEIVKPSYGMYMEDVSSLHKAFSACILAHSLFDWVFTERKITETSKKEKFREELYTTYPELKIIRDVSNSIKHLKITQGSTKTITSAPDITISQIPYGKGRYGEGPYGGTPAVTVPIENDKVRHVSAILRTAMAAWSKELGHQVLND